MHLGKSLCLLISRGVASWLSWEAYVMECRLVLLWPYAHCQNFIWKNQWDCDRNWLQNKDNQRLGFFS
jgi:hypothetical protein